MRSPAGRTIGAALGVLIFVLFFAEIAELFPNPVSAATSSQSATTAR